MDKQDKRVLRGLYWQVFSTPEGEAVLADLSQQCFVHKSTYDPDKPGNQLYFEGSRRVYLYIQAKLQEQK